MDDITIAGKKYCRLLVANDKYGTPDVIKIGDAFFKGFNANQEVPTKYTRRQICHRYLHYLDKGAHLRAFFVFYEGVL